MTDENKTMMQDDTGGEPAGVPRENMIATAVKFLQNPRVTQSPPSQKRTFLQNKGLSTEEIDIAFSRAGVTESGTSPPAAQGGVIQPGTAGPVVQTVAPPISGWTRFRDSVATAIVVGGISYAIYRLYKKYLMPLLYGPSQEERQLQAIQKSLTELQQNIQETLTSIKTMQDVMTNQQKQIQSFSESPTERRENVGHFVNEVKDEIKSLKGLMLGRKQFPPTPQTQPVLPAWQLMASKTEESTDAAEITDTRDSSSASHGDATTETSQEQPSAINEAMSRSETDDVLENQGEETLPIFNGHLTNGDPETETDPVIEAHNSLTESTTESKQIDAMTKPVHTHTEGPLTTEAVAS